MTTEPQSLNIAGLRLVLEPSGITIERDISTLQVEVLGFVPWEFVERLLASRPPAASP